MCMLVLLNHPKPTVHHTSQKIITMSVLFKVKVNTQIPPVGDKLEQQICSSGEQIMSRKHTKAPFLENHFKRREKKPQAQHYKTKRYGLLVLCLLWSPPAGQLVFQLNVLSFGVNFKWIKVNRSHGLSQSQTSWHPFRKWTKQNDQKTRWVEFKNIHSNMSISIKTLCWREEKNPKTILRCAITPRAFLANNFKHEIYNKLLSSYG